MQNQLVQFFRLYISYVFNLHIIEYFITFNEATRFFKITILLKLVLQFLIRIFLF